MSKEKIAGIKEDVSEGCLKGCLWSVGEIFDLITFQAIFREWHKSVENTGHPFRTIFSGAMENHRLFRGFVLTGGFYGLIRLCDLISNP
jgi:hypothetical protein